LFRQEIEREEDIRKLVVGKRTKTKKDRKYSK
jgi:hypothetical protein